MVPHSYLSWFIDSWIRRCILDRSQKKANKISIVLGKVLIFPGSSSWNLQKKQLRNFHLFRGHTQQEVLRVPGSGRDCAALLRSFHRRVLRAVRLQDIVYSMAMTQERYLPYVRPIQGLCREYFRWLIMISWRFDGYECGKDVKELLNLNCGTNTRRLAGILTANSNFQLKLLNVLNA